MIFVTVGTHEQPMNRLIQEIDRLIEAGIIREDVFIQRGIGSMAPRHCPSQELISYVDMVRNVAEARIIITHGGPGSIVMPLVAGKPPIVVPRQSRFDEHVDDHQVAFTKRLEAQKKVIAIYEIGLLGQKITNYEMLYSELKVHHTETAGLEMLVKNLERYCRSITVK